MAEKKYTGRTLAKAVKRYFDSISRDAVVTEKKPTGELDKYGHMIFEDVPVVNRLGETMTRVEFILPPTVGGLCVALGIHRSTWSDYGKKAEFADTVAYAGGLMRAWLDEQSLTRPGKDVRGVEFNLMHNFGVGKDTGGADCGGSVEDYLAALEEAGGGQEF